MPTQIALDKTDPSISEVIGMLTEGEPVTMTVTAIPGPTEDPVVMLDVTDIEIEEEGMMNGGEEKAPNTEIMPETQLREGGFDTGPVAPTKRNQPTQRPNQPHQ
ncbi:MAG: hypothetical protein ACWGQW_09510 [bacterium]|jgi:hypothetical protein